MDGNRHDNGGELSSTRTDLIATLRRQIGDENAHNTNGPDSQVWSDKIYIDIITDGIKVHSRYRPYKTTGTLTISNGTRRFSPPTGVDFRAGHRIDEIRYINSLDDYAITGWSIDVHQNKIDMGAFQSETKNYTCFISKSYDDFSGSSDTLDMPTDEEDLLLKWCRCQFWLKMSKDDFDAQGNLKPTSYTRGHISENFGESRRNMRALYDAEYSEWLNLIKQHGAVESGPVVTRDEWIPPTAYRVPNGDY